MATQLIPLHTRSINEQTLDTVNARDLHTFLDVGRHFATWLNARIKQYGFEMDVDYTIISRDTERGSGNRGATKDYFLTLDMAKELAMVERNDKGKQAHRYFIDCEKQLHEQKHIPATQPDNPDDKYKLLNTMILSMDFKTNPVVVSNIELVRLIKAAQRQQPIAQLNSFILPFNSSKPTGPTTASTNSKKPMPRHQRHTRCSY